MRKKLLILLAGAGVVIGALFLMLREKETIPGAGSYRDSNLLLITIDTLRADHLPAYGYTAVKTPNLDRFAAESLIFENAIAQAPMTLPSHASILTGLLPVAHGVRDNAGFVLDPKITTLAEILSSSGYQTAAFVSSFILDSQFGLDQGFQYYSDSFTLASEEPRVDRTDVYRRAEATEKEVEPWIKANKDKRFFLWVHYYDPHDPYDPPEPFKSEYKSNPYDGEIAYTDHVIGNLLATLDHWQLMDKTLIVITGDHGEGLGEHKERTHSLFLYNATLHVPLFIRLPVGVNRRIPGIVRHTDIAPTLLEWLGIPVKTQMQGACLLSLIAGKDDRRVAYSESLFAELHYGWSPLRSLTTEEYKFIEAPAPELYDRKNDPKELKNLMAQSPEVGNELRKQLAQIIRSETKIDSQKIDSETEEKLQALGYVTSTAGATVQSRRIDPKDRIDILESISQSHQALDQRDYRHVVEVMNQVNARDPNIVDAHFLLASAYLHLGEKEKALAEMTATLKLKPDHIQTLYNMGFFYQIQGNFEQAEHCYLQLLKYSPQHQRGMLNLAGLYLQANQPVKAQPYISRVIHSYEQARQRTTSPEEQSRLVEKMSEVYFKTGNLAESESKLMEAIRLTPGRPSLYFHLGQICRRTNRLNDAIDYFRKELMILSTGPQGAETQYALAETYLAANTNLEEALRLAERATKQAPSGDGQMLLAAIRERMKKK